MRRATPSPRLPPGARRRVGRLLPAAIGLVGWVTAGDARAQVIDYGELEAVFGEPVTVSATGKPERQSDTPVNMEILTAEDIRRSGAVDIPGVLRGLAGIDLWRFSPYFADVSVRGYNQPFASRLLTLINGRQVYVDILGWTPWSAMPVELDQIRQIEVIKGPSSALYGFNAVGGVINIITYGPLDDAQAQTGTVRVRGGTSAHRQVSAGASAQLGDRAGIRISAGAYDARDFSSAEGLPLATRDPRRRSLSADGMLRFGRSATLGLEFTASDSSDRAAGTFFEALRLRQDSRSAKVTATADTRLGLVDGAVYRNWFDLDVERQGVESVSKNRLTVARVQDLFKIGSRNSLRVGGEFRHSVTPASAMVGGRSPSMCPPSPGCGSTPSATGCPCSTRCDSIGWCGTARPAGGRRGSWSRRICD